MVLQSMVLNPLAVVWFYIAGVILSCFNETLHIVCYFPLLAGHKGLYAGWSLSYKVVIFPFNLLFSFSHCFPIFISFFLTHEGYLKIADVIDA